MSSLECTTPLQDIPEELAYSDIQPDPRTGELWASVDVESFRTLANWLVSRAYAEGGE